MLNRMLTPLRVYLPFSSPNNLSLPAVEGLSKEEKREVFPFFTPGVQLPPRNPGSGVKGRQLMPGVNPQHDINSVINRQALTLG